MIAEINHHGQQFRVDLSKPIDLSLPLAAGEGQVQAWYVDPVRMEPVRNGDTTYAVKDGAPVNFRNVLFNPHGHGTHTESVGHISPGIEPVGNYAICLHFDDEHNTGIYSWETLYRLGVNYEDNWQDYLNRLKAAGYEHKGSLAGER